MKCVCPGQDVWMREMDSVEVEGKRIKFSFLGGRTEDENKLNE